MLRQQPRSHTVSFHANTIKQPLNQAPSKEEQAPKEPDTNKSEYDTRNQLYSTLLMQYIASSRQKAGWNKVYKCIFFLVSMLILLVTVVVPVLVIVIIAQKEIRNPIVDLASLASGLISIISSIVVLPKIIAQHLFPTNEDNYLIELVKSMQLNDANIREFMKNNDPD